MWDPFTLYASNVLEMVQRRAARWVLRSYHNTSSVTAMLKSLGWRDLSQRRVDSRLKLMYKILNNLVDIDQDSYVKLQIIHSTTLYYKFSFFPRTITDWNNLPKIVIESPSLNIFKNKVMKIEHDLPF